MLLTELETRTQTINDHLSGIHICWGGDFTIEGNIFHRGVAHLLKGMPIIFPICLNNGYYNEGQLENLAKGISEFDGKIYAFLTDGPSKHNYIALGYSQEEAVRKTRLEGNGLLNRFKRGLYSIGEDSAKKFSYFRWEDIYRHPEWLKQHNALHRLYTANPNFRSDVEIATRQVLSHRKDLLLNSGYNVNSTELTILDVKKAIDYTLEEAAFVTVCHKLLQVEGVCYLYKEPWPVLQKLADDSYGTSSIPELGFLEFHVLPEFYHSDIPTILSDKQLSELSTKFVAAKPHRPNAPQAKLEPVILFHS